MKPLVLCFSGFDPSGGAGIQADIEAINANNAQAMTIITAITAQNTQKVTHIEPVNPDLIYQQAQLILAEFVPNVIKIGMLASIDTIKIIQKIIAKLPNIPLIIDPVFRSGSNYALSNENLETAFDLLLPSASLIIPNNAELSVLGGTARLLQLGVQNILLTQTDITLDANIQHIWHSKTNKEIFNYPKLPNKYHGSGCTLASSIAAHIAHKKPMNVAIKNGLDYTWQALKNTPITNTAQLIPNRTIT